MADPQPTVLETSVSLSQSVIWRLQRDYYIQRGLNAWSQDKVPAFITSNPFTAEIYARIVFSFMRDWGDKPLRILELGAGTGKFCYLFLRHLTELLRSEGGDPQAIQYCMTDCAEPLIESWGRNQYLAEFVKPGILKYEVLEIGEKIQSAFLEHSGPLVIIANYVLDSLPQDAFVARDGKMFEGLVSTTAPAVASPSLSQLQLSYTNAEISPDRYSDPAWNNILELYRNTLPAGTVLFPSSALRFLKGILDQTAGPVLALVADKGFPHQEELALCQWPPTLEFHGSNCFSQMVNLDAIAKYFKNIGGEALMPEKHSSSLHICAFLHGQAAGGFPLTRAEYQTSQAAFGPDDLFSLFAWLNTHMEEMTVPQILAALRLTRWDPIAFLRFFPILARQLRTVTIERNDLRAAMMRVWANHFPVQASENALAFDCGVILLEMHFFDEALSMFKISQQILGPSAPTSYNLGLCAAGLARTSEALQYVTEACNMDAQFEPARTMRRKLEEQIFQR
ncbi:MAG TPA: SAM-dependent methyltransferase [Candidatus Angelobacter sp.]